MIQKLMIVLQYLRVRHFRRFRSREQLLAWQERKTRGFLRWVLKRSPFYARRAAGLPLERWRELPPIDKSVMMANLTELNTAGVDRDEAMRVAIEAETSRFFSPTLGRITVGLSSGTSGNRGLFLVSPEERALHAGTIMAKVLPNSILSRNRVAFFLRANSNLYSTSKSSRLSFRFFDLIEAVESHVAALNEYQPTLIFAPPSVLRRLAEHKLRGELSVSPLKIVSVAEVLDPLDQAWIERAFGQKVHQVYQCTEGFLGITCREGTLHLNEDLVVIEKEWIDREKRKFIPVITDFSRTTQPIIRYRLNDILTARREPCPCGSPLQALDAIEGRSDDVLHFRREGSDAVVEVLPDFVRRAVLFSSPEVEEYWVRQREAGQLVVSLKVPEASRAQVEARVEEEFRRLGETMRFDAPGLTFSRELPEPGLRKLRRVERIRS